jgi:multicomponent Na+:H+ antiporter subunit G
MGSIGINRMQGVIPKLLTSSLIDTMAMILLVLALLFKTGLNAMGIRLIVVLFFVLMTTPVINHVLTKATYDALKEDENND